MRTLAISGLALCMACSSSSTSTSGFGGGVGVTGGLTAGSSGSSSGTGGSNLGNIALTWTFDGDTETCAALGIGTIQVVILNHTLQFPCLSSAGQQSGVVAGVPFGIQSFTVSALAPDGVTALASIEGQASVQAGTVKATVDLAIAPALGTADLSWTLAGKSCVAAGVQQMEVVFGDAGPLTLPCQGFADGGQSAVFSGLPLGALGYVLTGAGTLEDALGEPLATVTTYQASGLLEISADAGASAAIELSSLGPPADAGPSALLQWTFAGASCAAVQVSEVSVAWALVDGGLDGGSTFPCTAGRTADGGDAGGTQFAGAMLETGPGLYALTLSALGADDAGARLAFAASGTLFENEGSTSRWLVDLSAGSESMPDGGGVDGGLGALELDLSFGANGDCAGAGLSQVETLLFDAFGAPLPGQDLTTSCGSLPVAYSNLAPGTYYLSAQGLAGDVGEYALFQIALAVSPATVSRYSLELPPLSP